MNTRLRSLAILASVVSGGCAASSSQRSTATPAERHVVGEDASLCFRDDQPEALALLSRTNVQSVSPLYASFSSHGSVVARLRGASVVLRPGRELTKDRVENLVECHRQALRASSAIDDDPLALAEPRLHVSVESSPHGVVLSLACPQIEDARLVLSRATALLR